MSKNLHLTADSYYSDAIESLKKEFKTENLFALPKIEKISVNVGVGKYDNKQKQEIRKYLEKVVLQLPKEVKSNKSVAGFKLRSGDVVSYVATLRGDSIKNFLLHLIYIALPQTRDFKGLDKKSFNKNYSTYTIGIENASIFPVVGFSASVNFGMQVNVVFKEAREDNIKLLEKLHFPFKK